MFLSECFPNLGKEVLNEVERYSSTKDFPAGHYIIQQGQNIRFLPIVLEGNVKVFSTEASMQFLLYYVVPGESCIFSFAHIFNENPLEFSAQTEIDSKLLLLPIDKVKEWFSTYPPFSSMILKAYQKHYSDLLQTTKQITCYNLEERLLTYLKMKTEMEGSNLLKISHQEVANDLGTSREVISRLMRKLSLDKKATQIGRKIKVL